jgi:hypothetical protein
LRFIKAKELDRKFDAGEDIAQYLDFPKAWRSLLEKKKVPVDFPAWMIKQLDKEANRLGVSRQSIVKLWVAERLRKE